MTTVNYTVNQFALVDEKNEALTQLLTRFSWQDEPLLKLCLPLFPQIDVISCLDDAATMDAFRFNIVTRLKQLKVQGRELQQPAEVLDKLSFMWAAFFDERVIYESEIDTIQWENNTLVSQLFGIRNSGETFFTLVKQLLENPGKNIDLLQVSYFLLQLGFKGKYHDKRAVELNQFIAEISHVLNEFGALNSKKLDYSSYSHDVKKPYRLLLKRGLSPKWFWFLCGIACLTAVIFYETELRKLYATQQQEYVVMADETKSYMKSIEPEPHVIEQSDFIGQGALSTTAAATKQGGVEKETFDYVVEETGESVSEKTSNIEKLESLDEGENSAVSKDEKPQTTKVANYFVQLGVYFSESAAKHLLKKCENSQYPLQIEQANNKTYVGYFVEGFREAKQVSQYFADYCQQEAYIKEYK